MGEYRPVCCVDESHIRRICVHGNVWQAHTLHHFLKVALRVEAFVAVLGRLCNAASQYLCTRPCFRSCGFSQDRINAIHHVPELGQEHRLYALIEDLLDVVLELLRLLPPTPGRDTTASPYFVVLDADVVKHHEHGILSML